MKRLSLLAVTLAAATLLVAPAAASAATYRVRDSAGHTIGTVRPQGAYYAQVKNASGSQVGSVATEDGYSLVFFSDATLPYITLSRLSGTVWVVNAHGANPGHYVGRARHAGSSWALQKKLRGKWVTKGKVSGACKGRFAVGALRLLLW